ncbi:MAG TPA: sigma-54 dependent transcriptional regulator [bacterium]|nr:sigma-54 dependent transcriptional regulator [bacterium]
MTQRHLRIVLVDDDPEIAQAVVNYLAPEKYHIRVIGDGALVMTAVREEAPDVVILDVHLPSMSGLEILRQIKAETPQTPVIIVSGYVSTDNAIEAMRQGAFEYLTKPFRLAELERVLGRATGQNAGDHIPDDENVPLDGDQILGKSPEMVAVAKMIGQIALTDAPVLIIGETGTGKELVARAIVRNSARHKAPFFSVSCSGASPQSLEAELFGTFADGRTVRGKLEMANGGTIFLDEVADLSLLAQSRLYRVLEEKMSEPLEGGEKRPVNVRVIAASNQSLVDAMKEGRFRVDLFYMLKAVSVHLPPLRERKADIRLLCDYFGRKYSRMEHRPHKPLSTQAYERLLHYHWPGNVRELENAVHMAVLLSRESELMPEDFPVLADVRPAVSLDTDQVRQECRDIFARILAQVFDKAAAAAPGRVYADITAALEETLVEAALAATEQNQVRAAQLLGISRNTLRERMKRMAPQAGAEAVTAGRAQTEPATRF